MDLFTFLDLKYRQGTLELRNEFNIYKDGRIKAIHSLIGFMRAIAKWTSYPLIISEFLLVKLHLIAKPEEPIPLKKEELKPDSPPT